MDGEWPRAFVIKGCRQGWRWATVDTADDKELPAIVLTCAYVSKVRNHREHLLRPHVDTRTRQGTGYSITLFATCLYRLHLVFTGKTLFEY